ncbi:phosphotransferase [Microbacterium sp. BK668]|uniref:phosphotransferase n=1 Tax=Microbacterium sp. BK668 TaxID=2512118 RepID=UPI00105B2E54|nr:phosphotransferase [Microbacterium sp. BK668]TDN92640.1 aminoglycoside phosphotransferase (APT) family kinase protein [Microbacterium sp. BK668]
MPDKPAAEVQISSELVKRLVASQAADLPDLSPLPPSKVAEGWDSELWRLGDRLAARLPRRAVAAPLVLHEQRALDVLAPRVAAVGVGVPAPIVHGVPGGGFPWAWSVVPWFDGDRGLDVARPERSGWAERLAAALEALHRPAPADFPVNPVRGVPLPSRAPAVEDRMSLLRDRKAVPTGLLDHAGDLWRAGAAAATWEGPPVWIHGDLHPGNLIARGGTLVAIIDWGDVTAGDPAYDLAVAWLAFDEHGRSRFRAATADRYAPPTWDRARAWAAAVAVLLLAHSDDNPDYARLGHDTLEELARG